MSIQIIKNRDLINRIFLFEINLYGCNYELIGFVSHLHLIILLLIL